MGITHTFTSTKTQGGDSTLVGPNEWNATHTISSYLEIPEQSAPSTPSSGNAKLYVKSDGGLYNKSDDGIEHGPIGYPLDAYPLDTTYGDHFTAGSLSGSWTRRNFTSGAETYQVGYNSSYLRIQTTGRTNGDGYFRTAASGDWTYASKFIVRFFGGASLQCAWGIGVVDTNGTGVALLVYNAPSAPILIDVTTYSTYGGHYVQIGKAGSAPNANILAAYNWHYERPAWMYIRKSGTSYYPGFSVDGESWMPEGPTALTWAGTVDRVGMFMTPLGNVAGGGDSGYIDVDWFNKIA